MDSTLTLTYAQLQSAVGFFLGWGRGAIGNDNAWTTQQQSSIDDCVASGIRQFYFPPPLAGETSAYEWSFLRPTATLAFATGTSAVALPDDFGGFEGEISLSSLTGTQWFGIKLFNEGMVRQRYAELPTTTGKPVMAALQPIKGTGATQGQRWQLEFWPLADQTYTVQFQYWILPDYLSGAFPFAYGGAQHSETIKESCLAMAEQLLDDASTVHSQKFMERLAASVNQDRKSKPQSFGLNLDRSDALNSRWNSRCFQGGKYTYNGVSY